MAKALEGLPGVASVEADLKRNELQVAYDPAQVSVDRMLAAVEGEGYQAKAIHTAGPD